MWRIFLGFFKKKAALILFFAENKTHKQKTVMPVARRETVGFQFVYDFR
jgi:hypothetical protein